MNRRTMTPRDDEWPARLSEIGPHSVPRSLNLEGRELDCAQKSIAVVGARRPTAAGIEATEALVRPLAEAGFTIISGLAIGIDAAAHRAALRSGGYTIAVLGTGLDVDYPARNSRLRDDIRRKGTLVSEYRDGTQPRPHHFPARNRIVAGLSAGVIVVEGTLKSGALITARLALDSNRSVWAVPGSFRNRNAEGPNELIRTGQAALVTDVNQILEELAPDLVWNEEGGGGAIGPTSLGDEERSILEVLDDAPLPLERICMMTDLLPGKAALGVSRLEVRGLATRRFDGYEVTGSGARLRSVLLE